MNAPTHNDLLEEVQRVLSMKPTGPTPGFRMEEIMQQTGLSLTKSRQAIKKLQSTGRLRVVRGPVVRIDGVVTVAPYYSIVGEDRIPASAIPISLP